MFILPKSRNASSTRLSQRKTAVSLNITELMFRVSSCNRVRYQNKVLRLRRKYNTQQLLKNQFFSGGDEANVLDKIIRKIQEQYLAIQIENEYPKKRFWNSTLTHEPWKRMLWSADCRSEIFRKKCMGADFVRAAVLAPIAYSPTYRNPVKNPEENAEKRMEVLESMLSFGPLYQRGI